MEEEQQQYTLVNEGRSEIQELKNQCLHALSEINELKAKKENKKMIRFSTYKEYINKKFRTVKNILESCKKMQENL